MSQATDIERDLTNFDSEASENYRDPAEFTCQQKLGYGALCASCPLIAMFGDCPVQIRQQAKESSDREQFDENAELAESKDSLSDQADALMRDAEAEKERTYLELLMDDNVEVVRAGMAKSVTEKMQTDGLELRSRDVPSLQSESEDVPSLQSELEDVPSLQSELEARVSEDAESEGEREAEVVAESESEREAEVVAESEIQGESEGGSEIEVEANLGSRVESKTILGAEAAPEVESSVVVNRELEPRPESNLAIEPVLDEETVSLEGEPATRIVATLESAIVSTAEPDLCIKTEPECPVSEIIYVTDTVEKNDSQVETEGVSGDGVELEGAVEINFESAVGLASEFEPEPELEPELEPEPEPDSYSDSALEVGLELVSVRPARVEIGVEQAVRVSEELDDEPWSSLEPEVDPGLEPELEVEREQLLSDIAELLAEFSPEDTEALDILGMAEIPEMAEVAGAVLDVDADVVAELDTELDAELDIELDTELATELDIELDTELDTESAANLTLDTPEIIATDESGGSIHTDSTYLMRLMVGAFAVFKVFGKLGV